jgi:uncharacterized protein (TIGR02271 family)
MQGRQRGARGTGASTDEPVEPLGESRELVLELAAEELVPEKVVREVGQLRITKVVRTEEREVRVTVRREELLVERLAPEAAGTAADQAPIAWPLFEQGSLLIPLYEERVEVTKQPYVWQEVRVSKVVEEALQEVRATVRRETAQVEGAEDQPLST